MNDNSSSSSSSAAHNEYFAEDTLVTIIPSTSHPPFRFISGTFGPLEGGLPCLVPLWLAINLRKRGKCVLKMPSWMCVRQLEETSLLERTTPQLTALPFYYMEIAQLLLTHASADVAEPERVAALLQDVQNIRMDRLRMGISQLATQVGGDEAVLSTVVINISSMEILNVKSFLLNSCESFIWLRPPGDEEP